MANSPADKLLQDLARLDFLTYQHSIAVAEAMNALAKRLGLNEDQCLEAEFLGAIHDLGKLQAPATVFKKIQTAKPLTPQEREQLKTKPEVLLSMFGAEGLNPDLVEAIEQMGARFDGKGKPAMTGESIHQYARMLAVCDVYDFLDRRRAGDKGTPGKGRQALEAQKGKWLDPVIVDVFLSDKP